MLLGCALYVPLTSWDQAGDLREGAWLTLGGSVLLCFAAWASRGGRDLGEIAGDGELASA